METPLTHLLRLKEAAALLSTSEKTLSRLIQAGEVPGVAKIGAQYRLQASALLDWVSRGGSQASR